MNFLDDKLPSDFWSKAAPEPNSGCWLWIAALHSQGYGIIRGAGVTRYAARLTYETSRGPIGDELKLKNLCGTRCCVNPGHWRAMTQRAIARSGFSATKTHCKNGHAFTPENTYRRWGGGRGCLACSAGRKRLSEKAKKWRRENSLRSRLRSRFGMTEEDLEAMWNAQQGRCPICLVGMSRTGGRRESMHIDHDHATGRVRGLLCMLCNNALGSLRDNADAARRAADFLERVRDPDACNRETQGATT